MAKPQNYISIKLIMDDLLAHPLLQDLSLERAVNYAIELIRLVGIPQMFIEKTASLEIKDYRTVLPCDCAKLILITGKGGVYNYSNDNFFMGNSLSRIPNVYKVQGNILYTSLKEDNIEITYEAINLDDDGFPMIPDNSAFIKALRLYIKKLHFEILFDMGKLPVAALLNALIEYSWAIGQATNSLIMPDLAEMESISRMWNTLLTSNTEYKRRFATMGK